MTKKKSVAAPVDPTYRSGVAARLAGVPVETLRVWERRYGVVSPRLSSRGQRLYCADEIRRLVLIKQLVDSGHPIGAIAGLPTDALMVMRSVASTLGTPPGRSANDSVRGTRIALVGPLVSARRTEDALSNAGLHVVGSCVNSADAVNALGAVQADIAVIELPTLNDASIETVARIKQTCGASQAIVLYRFAPSTVIRRLRREGHEVARRGVSMRSCFGPCRLAQVR